MIGSILHTNCTSVLRFRLTVKPLPYDILGVTSPRRRAIIVHRGPPQVPPELALERAAARAMQHAPVIPNNHITWAVPRHGSRVLLLRGVCIKPLHQFPRVRNLFSVLFDMVQVRAHIQIHAPAGLVPLRNAVPLHRRRRRRIDIREELRRPQLPGVRHGVRAHVIMRQQPLSQIPRQLVERGPRVREVGVAAMTRRRQRARAQQRERRAPRVEGRVGVEQAVAAVRVRARARRVQDRVRVPVDVARVEQLVQVVPRLAAAD